MMLHPGRVVEHQSASSCCAGRCVVVRRTRSVKCAAVTFCTVFSHKNKLQKKENIKKQIKNKFQKIRKKQMKAKN